jgi:hypothetical protein
VLAQGWPREKRRASASFGSALSPAPCDQHARQSWVLRARWWAYGRRPFLSTASSGQQRTDLTKFAVNGVQDDGKEDKEQDQHESDVAQQMVAQGRADVRGPHPIFAQPAEPHGAFPPRGRSPSRTQRNFGKLGARGAVARKQHSRRFENVLRGVRGRRQIARVVVHALVVDAATYEGAAPTRKRRFGESKVQLVRRPVRPRALVKTWLTDSARTYLRASLRGHAYRASWRSRMTMCTVK